jgi:hypothetical protein
MEGRLVVKSNQHRSDRDALGMHPKIWQLVLAAQVAMVEGNVRRILGHARDNGLMDATGDLALALRSLGRARQRLADGKPDKVMADEITPK